MSFSSFGKGIDDTDFLHGVYFVDFSESLIFVTNFVYHIVVIKGVYTNRHKVDIKAATSIGITYIALGLQSKYDFISVVYQNSDDMLDEFTGMESLVVHDEEK